MPFNAGALGLDLGSHEEVVTAPRRLLAYAAGIGDSGPGTFDDASPGGVVAPPAFCVSLEWPVVIAGRGRDAFGLAPGEARRAVHASQDSELHRPIRPGDRLRTSGRVVEVRETRAGAFTMTRLSTVDAESGAPVVTSWLGTIYRGVAVTGEGGRLDGPAPLPGGKAIDWSIAAASTVSVAREAPHVYTECAQIWNPIHTERQVALAAGLPDIILHGTATWALAEREVRRARYANRPAAVRRFAGRFAAMVVPGSAVRVEHVPGARPGAVHFRVLNVDGEAAVTEGFIEFEA